MNLPHLHVLLDSNGGASSPLFELGNSLDDSCFVRHARNIVLYSVRTIRCK